MRIFNKQQATSNRKPVTSNERPATCNSQPLTRISHLLLLLLLSFSPLSAQFTIGVTLGGIAIHQGSVENGKFYKLKLDKKGRGVVIGAVNLSMSYRFNDYLGVRGMQSIIFHDSAGKFAGISHVGLTLYDDVVGMRYAKHEFSGSVGPFWYYRKGWTDIPGYQNDPEFNILSKDGKWERKFVWYGGFLKYDYFYDDDQSVSVDFLPGYPFIYALSAGWKCKVD